MEVRQLSGSEDHLIAFSIAIKKGEKRSKNHHRLSAFLKKFSITKNSSDKIFYRTLENAISRVNKYQNFCLIDRRVQASDKNSYHDWFGRIWTFVCEVRDAEHLEELRKTYSMRRISKSKSFECRTVEISRRNAKGKPLKERISAMKHRCKYRMLFVPFEKLKPNCNELTTATNETVFGALYCRGEHNHALIQRLLIQRHPVSKRLKDS